MKTLIIGASGELGSSISRYLTKSNHKVVVHGYKNSIRLNNLADEINADGVLLGDVSDENSVKSIIDQANKNGIISGLVYTAGINITAETIENTTLEDWSKTLNVNLTGAFLCVKYAIPYLRQTSNGSIVIVSSIFGISSPAHRGAYGASKHGLTGLIQSVAREEGEKIKINGVCPGPIWGENVRNIFIKHAKSANISVEEYIKERQNKIPYGRFMELEECASVIKFLLENDSSFLTGEVIRITGGEF